MAASMGFVVGSSAAHRPVRGWRSNSPAPLACTIRVAVDGSAGRASVVDDFRGNGPDGGDPARCPGLRAAGRRTHPSAPVEYDGDAEVGRRIVEKLNYVI